MKLFAAKVAVAVTAISAIILMAGSQVAPHIPSWKILSGAAAIAAVLIGVVLTYAFVAGSFRQLLLRWGAIDTQWLWMPDYPEGFKRHWRRGPEGGADRR